MPLSNSGLFWTTNTPKSWPNAPSEMTISTLTEIEACPRCWALSKAEYSDIWSKQGYPPRVQISTLVGMVVHLALRRITTQLVAAGCTSIQDPIALDIMRSLGGYSNVLNGCINQIVSDVSTNPRSANSLEFIEHTLRVQIPDIRTRLQMMLSRRRIPFSVAHRRQERTIKPSLSLVQGVFTELELNARKIGWKGKADLLILSPETCEIVDFKTGEPHEEHKFQIQVYALLWNRDSFLNPNGRYANRLILEYSEGDIEVPILTAKELDMLEKKLILRRKSAIDAISQRPIEAKPNDVYCHYCNVRQLCDKYWKTKSLFQIAGQAGEPWFSDLEVTVAKRHGPSSWDTIAGSFSIFEPGQPVLLRTNDQLLELMPGQQLRLLSVQLEVVIEGTNTNESPTIIATMGGNSEIFINL